MLADNQPSRFVNQKPTEKVCLYCGETAYYANGFVHEHGYTFTMECGAGCGWKGGQPAMPLTYATDICPKCGVQGKLRDNHCINPCSKEHFAKYGEEMRI
jgi:hypothetical protein